MRERAKSQDVTRAQSKLTAKKIAIVDDQEDLSSLLSKLVKRLGYQVEFVANDGKEIVEAVLEDAVRPDLILMDYRMPMMNGFQAARKIREAKPSIKIIITTADDSVRGDANAAGLLIMLKPFTISALSKTMEEALGVLR